MMDSERKNRKIVIVGGVAGGGSAAARARRMNEAAEIILLEKDGHVSFANCGLPYYVGGEISERDKLLVAGPEVFKHRFNIDVRVKNEVIAIDPDQKVIKIKNLLADQVYEETYDKLILATGASPFIPPTPGLPASNVYTMRNLEDTDRIVHALNTQSPKRALVIGAGFIGIEMVEQLHKRGIPTTLVELAPQALAPLDPEMARDVELELEKHGVELILGDAIEQFETDDQNNVFRAITQKGHRIETDFVMMAIGVRPNIKLAEDAGLEIHPNGGIQVDLFGLSSDQDIYAVGDNSIDQHGVSGEPTRVPLGGPANRAGRVAGEHAATGDARQIPAVMGTAIVRVFELTAAVTGLNEKTLIKAGTAYRSVVVKGGHHASYYPGAAPMKLKLLYTPEGKILGAQAVGGAGIDKRMDVIATMQKFGGTVEDLTELDLSYAPPFGSAKDVLHMAGFVAQNDLRGISPIAPMDVDLDSVQLLDVRSDSEYIAGHLPNAIHIPLELLRARLDEIEKDKPVVVTCQIGLRGHIATRILLESGFNDVRNLTGGMMMQASIRSGELLTSS